MDHGGRQDPRDSALGGKFYSAEGGTPEEKHPEGIFEAVEEDRRCVVCDVERIAVVSTLFLFLASVKRLQRAIKLRMR